MERQKDLDITGKVVIVTGASRGMGRQAAIMFARRGAKVAMVARTVEADDTQPGSLGEALKEIEEFGGEAIAVQSDLGKLDELHKIVDTVVDKWGGIDILVNNAAMTTGSAWAKKFIDLSFGEWTQQFDINLHAPFILMQLIAPIMEKRGGGRFVNLTTGSHEVFRKGEEDVPPPDIEVVGRNLVVPGYFASKRALDRLDNVIAPELRKMGIYIITMNPGWVATEIVQARLEGQGYDWRGADNRPVPMSTPARMMVYFATCADPEEYTGRVFWAEREMAEMDIPADVMAA